MRIIELNRLGFFAFLSLFFTLHAFAQTEVSLETQVALTQEAFELIDQFNHALGQVVGTTEDEFTKLFDSVDANAAQPLFIKGATFAYDFSPTKFHELGEPKNALLYFELYRDYFELAAGQTKPHDYGLTKIVPFKIQEHSAGMIFIGRVYSKTKYNTRQGSELEDRVLVFDFKGEIGKIRISGVSICQDLLSIKEVDLLSSKDFHDYLQDSELLLTKSKSEQDFKDKMAQLVVVSNYFFKDHINRRLSEIKESYLQDPDLAMTEILEIDQLNSTHLRRIAEADFRMLKELTDEVKFEIENEISRRRNVMLSEREKKLDDARKYQSLGEFGEALKFANAAHELLIDLESESLTEELEYSSREMLSLKVRLTEDAKFDKAILRDSIVNLEKRAHLREYFLSWYAYQQAINSPIGDRQVAAIRSAAEHINACIEENASFLPARNLRIDVYKILYSNSLIEISEVQMVVFSDYRMLARQSARMIDFASEGFVYLKSQGLLEDATEVLNVAWNTCMLREVSSTDLRKIGFDLAQNLIEREKYSIANNTLEELRKNDEEVVYDKRYWVLVLKAMFSMAEKDKLELLLTEFRGIYDAATIKDVINDLRVYFMEEGINLEYNNRVPKALIAFSATTMLDPYFTEGWVKYAESADKLNLLHEADSALKQAKKLAEDSKRIQLKHAEIELSLNRIPENLDLIKSYAKDPKSSIDENIVYMVGLQKAGRFKEASAQMNSIKKVFKSISPADYRFALFKYYSNQKKPSKKKALKALKKWAKEQFDGPSYFFLANAHLDFHNYSERSYEVSKKNQKYFSKSLKYYKKSLALGQDAWIVNKYLGSIELNRRNLKDAQPFLEKAVKQNTRDLETRINLAILQFYRNEAEASSQTFSECRDFGLIDFIEEADNNPFIGVYGIAAMACFTSDYLNVSDLSMKSIVRVNDWKALMRASRHASTLPEHVLFDYSELTIANRVSAEQEIKTLSGLLQNKSNLIDMEFFENTSLFKKLTSNSKSFKKMWKSAKD